MRNLLLTSQQLEFVDFRCLFFCPLKTKCVQNLSTCIVRITPSGVWIGK